MVNTQSNFQFVSSYCEARFNVEKYQSNKTGMKLYHINVPLPLIKLEICVQTKPYDDTGCAHTLEHLIFLGSRKYPHQGYLDHIAAQYYSLGTNATTYRDMTTYELTTVHSQSILTLLPIYLDHIFHPILNEDCYLTEVHHISGETGEDVGVVYSEIQSSENQAEEILLFSLMRDLWSEKTPFYYESGGRLESIRNELTLDKIKIFHQKFYKPKNVAIILCGGGINLDEILQGLNQFEQEYFLEMPMNNDQPRRKKLKYNNDAEREDDNSFPQIHIKRASFDATSSSTDTLTHSNVPAMDKKKLSVQFNPSDAAGESSFCDSELMVSHGDSSAPSSPVASSCLAQDTDPSSLSRPMMNEYKEILYPVEDNDENLGQVAFAYRLESIYNMEIYTALDVLLTTLFDEDISIFYKEFIEIPNTLCSSIDHDWFNYSERVLTITFEGIEVEDLTLVADKFTSVLYSIVNSSENNDQLYLQIQQNIKKKIELHLNEIENEPFDYLTDLCCLDHVSELALAINETNTNDNADDNEDDEHGLNKFLRNKSYLENLYQCPMTYWYGLIKKYLLEWDSSRRTIILLKPSNELLIEQQEQEEQRIVSRRQSLGSTGLIKLKDRLNQARENNNQSSLRCSQMELPPLTYLDQLHLPPIDFLSSESQLDLFHSPISQFNRFVLHIPLLNLSPDLQCYLPLYSNLLFHTPIDYKSIQLSKFDFCQLITRDILSSTVTLGQSSSSPVQSSYVFAHYMNQFVISLQSLNSSEIFRNTIDYFRYVLFGSRFDDYKIIIEECEKQLKMLIETLQDGQTVHQTYFNSLLYANEAKHFYHRMNIFLQKNLLEKICKHPDKYQEEILEKLQRIQSIVRQSLSQVHMTVCGNVDLIRKESNRIDDFLVECRNQNETKVEEKLGKEVKIPSLTSATIIGSPHEESGYVLRWVRQSIVPSDFVPLLILSNYLDMENGPLWTACRTNGYSYGVAFDFDFEMNLVLLSINQCSQLKLAYSSALTTLKDLVERRFIPEKKRLDAARNLTICMLTEHLATLGRATNVCIRSYLNSYSIEKYEELLNEIHSYQYNEEQMKSIIERYLSPLIDDRQSFTLILVNSNKMKETDEFLREQYQISSVTLIKDIVKYFSR